MANELVKWTPPRSKADEALQLVRRQEVVQRKQEVTQQARYERTIIRADGTTICEPMTTDAIRAFQDRFGNKHEVIKHEVIDLIRACSVLDKPFASRYVHGSYGVYHYHGPIIITPQLYRRLYEDNTKCGIVPNSDLAHEVCPHCGAEGMGAILCPACKMEVCWGKTVHKTFRCRCGHEAGLSPAVWEHRGINPQG